MFVHPSSCDAITCVVTLRWPTMADHMRTRLQATLNVPLTEAALIGAAVLGITMAAFFRVPLLPAIGSELSMSAGDLGLFTTFFAIGRLLTDIPAGRYSDRIPAARLMGLSALVVGVGSFLLAGAHAVSLAYLAAFALGIGSAMTNTGGMTFFSQVTTGRHRGMALSAFSAALLGGQAFGPTFGGLLAGLKTWRVAEISAGVVALILLGGLLRSPARPTASRNPARTTSTPLKPFAPRRVRWVLYGVPFAMFATFGSMVQTLIPIIGDADLGLSSSDIGLALGLGGLARLLGALIGGQLTDRVSRKGALIPGLLVQAAGVGLLVLPMTTFVWTASIVIMSLASYGISVAATIIADLASAGNVGRNLGTFRFVGDIGLIIAPALTALLYEHFGTAPSVLPMAGLLTVVALAGLVIIPETRGLQTDPGEVR